MLFNRARNSTIKSRFYLTAHKRHLAGPGSPELAAARGCAHADDPLGQCPACLALARRDDDNLEE